jgi:pilus assembly protein CpaD
MNLNPVLRGLAIACILVAGSCAASNDAHTIAEDGALNHPIAVEPSFREIKLQYAGGAAGMTADDAVRFDAFLTDYRTHGNGSLGISVPAGAPAHAAIAFFGERAAASGISRDKILVSTHDAVNGDFRVDVSYITYTAHTESCGDWSEDLAYTADNQTPKNFGCAVQQNIAAMVADPRDLIAAQPMGPVDSNRRGTVMGLYEQGKITQAEKKIPDASVEQSAPGSGIGAGN